MWGSLIRMWRSLISCAPVGNRRWARLPTRRRMTSCPTLKRLPIYGPINTQSFEGNNGKVETYSVRANSLDMLKRKNARSSDAPVEAAAELTESAPF